MKILKYLRTNITDQRDYPVDLSAKRRVQNEGIFSHGENDLTVEEKMKSNLIYKIPVFSTHITDFVLRTDGMDVYLEFEGYDETDALKKVIIKFDTVVCYKHTLSRFTSEFYDISYEKVVELTGSKWLKKLKKTNPEEFNRWNPKHYVLFLHYEGMYQFMARSCEMKEVQ